jgi:hypothetical protein
MSHPRRACLLVFALLPMSALAQVPVHDAMTFQQATQTAKSTQQILDVSKDTLTAVKETLQAVTGQRSTGSLSQLAIGNGFTVGSTPSLGQLISGGTLSWGAMGGDFARTASTLINGLSLVQSLSKLKTPSGVDKSYSSGVNTVAALTALISGAQSASQTRLQSFRQATGSIGQAGDVKDSIEQNTQVQVQTGLTVNELIGVMNGAVTALNQQSISTLTEQSGAAQTMRYDAAHNPFKKLGAQR